MSMGVYIKCMEMPTRCGRCVMRIPAYDDGAFDHYECCITVAMIDNLGEKMEDCPLVPLPPHGRLIEAERLKEVFHRNVASGEAFDQLIDIAPTIIQASEEG